ncbi:hypothetical protein A2U01_0053927, partial [Trifolium medium]|nr:hypothetical protein [Trifolium medium]
CSAKREFKVLARFLRQRSYPRLGTSFGEVTDQWSARALWQGDTMRIGRKFGAAGIAETITDLIFRI